MSRYQFQPSKVEFPPVEEHPFQQALRGLPCDPPADLSPRGRAEWERKWRNGDRERLRREGGGG